MQTFQMDAELASPPPEHHPQQQESDMFQRQNDLRVIQEYNREDNMPEDVRKDYWGLVTKSIKLGFWDKEDEVNLFFHKNTINVGGIMSKPKHKYTFEDMQQMNQLSLLMYADFKRGVGMDKWKINERTLQSAMITQQIQGAGGALGKKAGVMGSLRNLFS